MISKWPFDPQILQARWVLGGVEPTEFVELALSALEHGIGGTALQQLAGLSEPTVRDLDNLPARLFAELGLKPIDRDAAVGLLLAREQPPTHAAIRELCASFPAFTERWKKHVVWWGGNPAGSYNDMAEFVNFTVEDLYEKGSLEETRRVFKLLETMLVDADEETRNLIGLGFFETLQNFASWRAGGNKVYVQFFGPISRRIWAELQEMWAGKSSLMDVIRAEKEARRSDKS